MLAQRASRGGERRTPVPLEPGSEGSCQIGGDLATNAGGIAVLAYGNARDLDARPRSGAADGQRLERAEALRKDNRGYDLKDLFIGVGGNARHHHGRGAQLFPKPAATVTAFAASPSSTRRSRSSPAPMGWPARRSPRSS